MVIKHQKFWKFPDISGVAIGSGHVWIDVGPIQSIFIILLSLLTPSRTCVGPTTCVYWISLLFPLYTLNIYDEMIEWECVNLERDKEEW